MCEGLGGGVTLLVVDLETALDEVLGLLADELELRMVKVILTVDDFVENLISAAALKWQITTHEYVEDNAQRPNIALGVVVTVENLRSHVVWRAGDGLTFLGAVDALAEPEVDQLQLPVRRQHDVVGLDITVDDALRVQVVQRREQFPHVKDTVLFGEGLIISICDLVKKLAAADVLHDEVNELLIDISLVVLDDVRMVQLG